MPFNARLHSILPNTSPTCSKCTAQETETPLHGLFECEQNSQAALYLLHLSKPYDSSISQEKCLTLSLKTSDPIYELPPMLILGTGLNLIWQNRQNSKRTTLYQIRSELECLVSLLRKSRSRRLREAGNIINNTMNNFPFNC